MYPMRSIELTSFQSIGWPNSHYVIELGQPMLWKLVSSIDLMGYMRISAYWTVSWLWASICTTQLTGNGVATIGTPLYIPASIVRYWPLDRLRIEKPWPRGASSHFVELWSDIQ